MALTLACESELMIRTFLRNWADSVSAIASTRVDFPTPPFVFMTAIVLRMPRQPIRALVDKSYPPRLHVMCMANVAVSRWAYQGGSPFVNRLCLSGALPRPDL